jgi:hypothetical protein
MCNGVQRCLKRCRTEKKKRKRKTGRTLRRLLSDSPAILDMISGPLMRKKKAPVSFATAGLGGFGVVWVWFGLVGCWFGGLVSGMGRVWFAPAGLGGFGVVWVWFGLVGCWLRGL